jgi:hypothetical protein
LTVPIDSWMSSLAVKVENGVADPRLNFLREIVSFVPSAF